MGCYFMWNSFYCLFIWSEYNNIYVIILQLVEITFAATLACAVTLFSTLSHIATTGELACAVCIMVHAGTAGKVVCAGQRKKNSAFSVNIAQTEEFIASVDYSYHQHWLEILKMELYAEVRKNLSFKSQAASSKINKSKLKSISELWNFKRNQWIKSKRQKFSFTFESSVSFCC